MDTCHTLQRRLSEYVDDELRPDDRALMAQHLATCASCRGLAADLATIRETARTLGPIGAPDHAWLGVAGHVRHADRATARRAPRAARGTARHAAWQWVALAAGLVLVSLLAYLPTRRSSSAVPASASVDRAAGNPVAPGSVESVADELQQAAAHYESAIQQLEVLAKNGDQTLTPDVATTLQRNLTVIDQAIGESRTALQQHPESEPARASLFEALRRKVTMLQTTVALMNEMRKGDADAVAKITGRKSSS